MRYLVTARVKSGKSKALRQAIDDETIGRGSVAGDEYLRNMGEAREYDDGRVQWVEVCYCATPLDEERAYWETYFHLDKVQDAHARSRCRDQNDRAVVVRRLRLLCPAGSASRHARPAVPRLLEGPHVDTCRSVHLGSGFKTNLISR